MKSKMAVMAVMFSKGKILSQTKSQIRTELNEKA